MTSAANAQDLLFALNKKQSKMYKVGVILFQTGKCMNEIRQGGENKTEFENLRKKFLRK